MAGIHRTGTMMIALLIVIVTSLAGCGGGGGGDGGNGNGGQISSPVSYAGSTSPAILASARVGADFAAAAVVPGTFCARIDQITVPLAPIRSVVRPIRTPIDFGLLIVGDAGRLLPSGEPSTRTAIEQGRYGAEGGSLALLYTTDDATGFLTRIQSTATAFDDSVDGTVNPVNGTMDFRFTAWDSVGNPIAYTASFVDFRVNNGTGVVTRFGGSYTVTLSLPSRITVLSDFVVVESGTGRQVWQHQMTEVIDYSPDWILPESLRVSLSGTLYISDAGSVIVGTSTPLVFTPAGDHPTGGSLVFSGGGEASTKATFGTTPPEIHVEVDRNGDGISESAGDFRWSELLLASMTLPSPRISVLATVPNPSSLVVKDNTLFFSDASEMPVKKISLTTGSATPLAGKIGTISVMTIRGSAVYWVDDSPFSRVLKRTALDGIGTTILHSGGSGTTGVLLDGTSEIVVDEGNVYWVIRNNMSMLYSLVKVPLDGSPPITITSTQIPIKAIAVDGSNVYWEEQVGPFLGDNGVLRRAPISGGDSEVLASGFRRLTGGMALSGTNLFFSDTTDGNTPVCRIMKISTSGGDAIVLASGSGRAFGLAVDGVNVFWAGGNSINSVPVDGGASVTLATPARMPSSLTVDSTSVIWSEPYGVQLPSTNGSVSKVPKGGGASTVIAAGLDTPHSLAFDPSGWDVYWAEGIVMNGGSARIRMVPSGGGAVLPVVGGVQADSPRMAVNASNVYIADGSYIKKCSVNGGPLETMVTSMEPIVGLAADNTNVYWIERIGRVLRIPIDGGTITQIGGGMGGPMRIVDGYVYWMASFDTISRAAVDGNSASAVVTSPGTYMSDFTVDENYVYFSDQDSGDIKKVPVGGGVVTRMGNGLGASYNILAVDSGNLYWEDQVHIGKIPLDGVSGISYIVPGGLNSDYYRPSLVVDSAYLYWTETGSGEIRRMTK